MMMFVDCVEHSRKYFWTVRIYEPFNDIYAPEDKYSDLKFDTYLQLEQFLKKNRGLYDR